MKTLTIPSLSTGKTHDTKRNDRFCPQSHAVIEKAFEHL